MAMTTQPEIAKFGPLLRHWRQNRRLSQLDLALGADVSSRHISFLETGRARPSRSMVMHLAESMDVPVSARNALLNAAGFVSAYTMRARDADDMQPVADAVAWMLQRHMPYPGILFDRHWTLLDANEAAHALLAANGFAIGDSLLALFAEPDRLKALIVNWEEVGRHIVTRLHTETAHYGGDAVLEAAANKLDQALPKLDTVRPAIMPPVIPTQFRSGSMVLSLFSTITQFGSAEDIALADYKIEFFFPADEPTRLALCQAGGTVQTGHR